MCVGGGDGEISLGILEKGFSIPLIEKQAFILGSEFQGLSCCLSAMVGSSLTRSG